MKNPLDGLLVGLGCGFWREVIKVRRFCEGHKSQLFAAMVTLAIPITFKILVPTVPLTERFQTESIVYLSLLIVVAFLYRWGTSDPSSMTTRYYLRSKTRPTTKVAVLIVPDEKFGEQSRIPHYYSDYRSPDWISELKQFNDFDVHSIAARQICEPNFAITINPFGETYPEEDRANLKTLNKIMNYIENGGVFVNVAGIPFCYLWDIRERVRDIPTGPVQGYMLEGERFLSPISFLGVPEVQNHWARQRFGLLTTLDTGEHKGPELLDIEPVEDNYYRNLPDVAKGKANSFRSAIRCLDNRCKLIPLIRCRLQYRMPPEKDPIETCCYPLAAIRYGFGYLIHCGLSLSSTGNSKRRPEDFNLIIAAIRDCVIKLREVGML